MILPLKDGGQLYYETHGESGEWLLFLNGIMMSTPSWATFIPYLKPHYRLLLVDFRDQGKSSSLEGSYSCQKHVPDLLQLLDHLHVPKIHMMGVSYGGQVALEFMRTAPSRVKTLMLVTVIPEVTNFLRAWGDAWDEAAALNDGEKFFQIAIPPIYSESFYEEKRDWLMERQKMFKSLLTPRWFEGFVRLSRSAKEFDCTDVLSRIDVPTLVVCAEKDILTPAPRMKDMARQIPGSTLLEIPDAGHAAFLEKPLAFLTAILGFLQLHSG